MDTSPAPQTSDGVYLPEAEPPTSFIVAFWAGRSPHTVARYMTDSECRALLHWIEDQGYLYHWSDQVAPALRRQLKQSRQSTHSGTAVEPGRSIYQQINAAISVEELASYFTDLKPAGPGKSKGLCPLHSEKTPSFFVYQDSGRWMCYGACAHGGDAFDLAKELDESGKL